MIRSSCLFKSKKLHPHLDGNTNAIRQLDDNFRDVVKIGSHCNTRLRTFELRGTASWWTPRCNLHHQCSSVCNNPAIGDAVLYPQAAGNGHTMATRKAKPFLISAPLTIVRRATRRPA
ncbi:hypothetical protein CEK25_004156 [Fusarium fujikuroi]|nr:hypothetical protein CEK25_004156 [Fusarium fujikuroi]